MDTKREFWFIDADVVVIVPNYWLERYRDEVTLLTLSPPLSRERERKERSGGRGLLIVSPIFLTAE